MENLAGGNKKKRGQGKITRRLPHKDGQRPTSRGARGAEPPLKSERSERLIKGGEAPEPLKPLQIKKKQKLKMRFKHLKKTKLNFTSSKNSSQHQHSPTFQHLPNFPKL